MPWQFQINGDAAAPIRSTKNDALGDALEQGHASWKRHKTIGYRFVSVDAAKGGKIVKIEERTGHCDDFEPRRQPKEKAA